MNATYATENLTLLTVEQAMADYVYFLKSYQRDTLKCAPNECAPIVAFGGYLLFYYRIYNLSYNF